MLCWKIKTFDVYIVKAQISIVTYLETVYEPVIVFWVCLLMALRWIESVYSNLLQRSVKRNAEDETEFEHFKLKARILDVINTYYGFYMSMEGVVNRKEITGAICMKRPVKYFKSI